MHTAPTFTAQHVFSFLRGMNMPQYASESGQAIELQPAHGLHAIYSNRSAAKLTLGESEDALEDALKAVQLAPRDFITVWRHCGCAAVISFRGARSRG
mmetsp:Transcript_35916/g.101732  ORF Transcript_35916/g.101732 Transcript_35916/m.101732 type:complete len:98 (-) Transcript_35916:639-932(-)